MSRLFITLVVLLAATAAKAEYEFPNYFTIGANDTLCIAQGCDTVTAPVKAHFSDGVSRWDLTVTYPEGLNPIGLYGGPDMDVTYLNSEGQTCIYHAVVTASQELTVISTQIDGYGDSIDVSSLPDGYYTITITSSNNNQFEGTFYKY